MKKRLYSAGGVLLLAAAVWLWASFAPQAPRDVIYEGQPLSHWLACQIALRPTDDGGFEPAYFTPPWNPRKLDTVVHVDSNAVPFLLRVLEGDRRIGAKHYREWLWPRLPDAIQSHLPPPPPEDPRNAALFLGTLGLVARPTAPALVRAGHESGENDFLKMNVVWALGNIGAGDDASITFLIEALERPNERYPYGYSRKEGDRSWAVNGMRDPGAIGIWDRAALFGLVDAMRSPVPEERTAASNVWRRLAPTDRSKADAIATRVDYDARIRSLAARSLALLGQRHERPIHALVTILSKDIDEDARGCAAAALGNLHSTNRSITQALATAVQDKSPRVRYAATNALLKFDPAAAARAAVNMPSP